MVKEENKFVAEIYKISGFALMAPFGRYFLIFSSLKSSDITVLFFIHLIVSVILFCIGVVMIEWAYEEIKEM